MKAQKYEEMVKDDVESKLQIKSLALDKRKLQTENVKVNTVSLWILSPCLATMALRDQDE